MANFFMAIYKKLFLAGFVLLLFSCGNKDKKNKGTRDHQFSKSRDSTSSVTSTDLQQLFKNPGVNQWKEEIKKDYPHFSVNYFEKKEIHSIPGQSENFSKLKWQNFKPYFIPSPNREQAIDLYSYGEVLPDSGKPTEGGMPDSEVNLVNLSQKTKTRLLFAGPGTSFQKASWLNDSVLIVTGESDANEQNEMQPVCWIVDTYSGTITAFDYRDATSAAPQ